MKLSIRNFAKLKEADILINGITVIAGNNDTGKSTIGKVLYSLFNSTSNISEKITNQRFSEIEGNAKSIIYNHAVPQQIASMLASRLKHRLKEAYQDSQKYNQIVLFSIIHEVISADIKTDTVADIELQLQTMISEKFSLSSERLIREFISRHFQDEFRGQINSLTIPSSVSDVELLVKNKRISLSFTDNECSSYKSELLLKHKAVYLDNPFLLDDWSYGYFFPNSFLSGSDEEPYYNPMNGLFDAVIAKEKLVPINERLRQIVKGSIVTQNNGEHFLQQEGFSQPLSLANLSTGLKSFVILKILLERNIIKEEDVLIFDEPEIHLHPQWQIAFAELLVLLQKQFELSLVVTTHSPYFLDAINLYSIKYGTAKNANYYLAEEKNRKICIENVNDSIDKIYKKMVTPIQLLDTLRQELNSTNL